MNSKIILLMSCVLFATFSYADSSDYDIRVKKALLAEELKYKIDDDGDFEVRYSLEDDRTHMAIVKSTTEQYKNIEVREITALAYISERPLTSEKLLYLLKDSNNKKLGGWVILNSDSGKYGVAFTIKIDANAPTTIIKDAIICAIRSADELEKKWTNGRDEF